MSRTVFRKDREINGAVIRGKPGMGKNPKGLIRFTDPATSKTIETHLVLLLGQFADIVNELFEKFSCSTAH